MLNKKSEGSRTQFQVDRIAFFSDAVIAIAITLMLLEIKLPNLGKNSSVKEIVDQYGQQLFLTLIAVYISFVTIGSLWMRHHELYEHINNYDKKLVKINLYFLFTIMLLPITISFLFNQDQPSPLKIIVFLVNLFLCNLLYYIMVLVIFYKKNNFSSFTDKVEISKMKWYSLIITFIYLASIFLLLFGVGWYYMPFIAVPVMRTVFKKISKHKDGSSKNSCKKKKQTAPSGPPVSIDNITS